MPTDAQTVKIKKCGDESRDCKHCFWCRLDAETNELICTIDQHHPDMMDELKKFHGVI